MGIKYLGQDTNIIILGLASLAIIILVGATVFFQFNLDEISSKKGTLESNLTTAEERLADLERRLNETLKVKEILGKDVGTLGNLYNQTESELSDTKSTLTSTQTELTNTKKELDTTKSLLDVEKDKYSDLVEIKDALCDYIDSLGSNATSQSDC